MPHHLIISGAPSTGKSSLLRRLRQAHPRLEDFYDVIMDGGRWWVEMDRARGGTPSSLDTMSREDRARMQREITSYYVERTQAAKAKGKAIIADAFFAEVLAYGLDCLEKADTARVEDLLRASRREVDVLLLPISHIALEQDGLRHGDAAFREEVQERILTIYAGHDIPVVFPPSASMEERLELVEGLLRAQCPEALTMEKPLRAQKNVSLYRH